MKTLWRFVPFVGFFVALFIWTLYQVDAGDWIFTKRVKFGTTNLSVGTWTIVGTLPTVVSGNKPSSRVHFFNTTLSGTVFLGVGPTNNVGTILVIHPGESGIADVNVGKNAEVSLQAADAAISAGDLSLDFL